MYQYPHHRDSVQKLLDYFADTPGVLAVVLGGSVAKGLARPDSDVDALVILTEPAYEARRAEGRLSECISGYCTYPEGYFDIKYLTKAFLSAVSDHGSEPARNAFRSAVCLRSSDPEIPVLVSRIAVYPKALKADKMLSFYSALSLNTGYFWDMSRHDNLFLKVRTASEIVLWGFRLLLADREVLFPCQKALAATVRALPDKPEGIAEKADQFLSRMDDESKEAFVSAVLGGIRYTPPEDYSEVLTRYIDDFEQWWLNGRPNVIEW